MSRRPTWCPVVALAGAILLGATSVAARPTSTPGELAREAALRTIARAEDERDARGGAIAAGLADRDPVVRARAALAAGRLQDSTFVPALLSALADSVDAVVEQSEFAIGQIGNRAARPALEPLLASPDPGRRALAVEALGKLGDRAATPRVVERLDDASAPVRAHAAVGLWRLADSTAARALIAHLGERDPAVRWRLVYALEKLPATPAGASAVEGLLRDPDALVRAHAARTLGRLRLRPVPAGLLAALADRDPAVVVNAIRAVQGIADSACAECGAAVSRLLAHGDPAVRVTAATALAEPFAWQRGDVVAIRAALAARLADSDAATRGAAGRALLARTGAEALAAVGPLFDDASPYARTAALDGLRGQAGIAAAPLAHALAPGRPLIERMTAAEIAGQLLGAGGGPGLGPLLDSLRAGLDRPEVLHASACAAALGDAHDSLSVGALAASYARRGLDADADARLAIRDALRSLAGQAFADSIERAHPSSTQRADYGEAFYASPDARGARIETDAGTMEWRFENADAPQTVKNFVRLARGRYFDGAVVHRVVPDFVIQDGDPTGTGSGGPGYTIRCEYNALRYEPGMVGMALSGKDTGGSQWFVTLSPQPHLDGRYTIFARVMRGMDVARRITQGTVVRRVEILR